jgi:DNA-binding NarL/FixJ family response regulator
MDESSLTQVIREVFEQETRSIECLPGKDEDGLLAGLDASEIPIKLHDRAVPHGQQDELLAAIIVRLRRIPNSGWKAVFLDALAPALVDVRRRLVVAEGSGLDDADLDQQIIVEAIDAALTIPLPVGARWIQRRIERRVATRMARWLIRQARANVISLDVLDVGAIRDPQPDDQLDVEAFVAAGLADQDIAILCRLLVLGQTIEQVARTLAVSPTVVVARRRRALRRLRRAGPTAFRRGSNDLPTAA